MTLHSLCLTAIIALLSLVELHGQAVGVTIAEQSPEGLDHEDDEIAAQVEKLDKAKQLVSEKELQRQMKKPQQTQLNLPTTATKKLEPAEIAKLARASAVRVGWTFLCGNCGDWHLELAGGYAITADGAIATCAHVLEAPPMEKGSLIVVGYDGIVHPVTSVLVNDEAMDAAIVKIDAKLVPLPFNDQVRPGDAAFCYSDPLEQRGYFSRGMVNRFIWDRLDRGNDESSIKALRFLRLNVSTPWAPGSSGAPVLDQQGNVIGHVSEIATLGDGYGLAPDQRKPDAPATISDVEDAIPLITLHSAIPARSVIALAKSLQKQNATPTESK